MINTNEIISIIEKYFEQKYFYIEYDEVNKSYKITDNINKILYVEIFYRTSNNLTINHIIKSSITGNEILKRIELIAKDLNVYNIHLKDWSVINIYYNNNVYTIDLLILTLLLNGKTWYNNHGYLSEFYEDELKYNEIRINMKFIDFYKEAIDNILIFQYNTWNRIITEIEIIKDKNILLDKIQHYINDEQTKYMLTLPENVDNIIINFKGYINQKINNIKLNKTKVLEKFILIGYNIENSVKDIMKQISDFIKNINNIINEDIDKHLIIINNILHECYDNIKYDRCLCKTI